MFRPVPSVFRQTEHDPASEGCHLCQLKQPTLVTQNLNNINSTYCAKTATHHRLSNKMVKHEFINANTNKLVYIDYKVIVLNTARDRK